MRFDSLQPLLQTLAESTRPGQPTALIFAEDRVLLKETVEKLIEINFTAIAVLDSTRVGETVLPSPALTAPVGFSTRADVAETLNRAIAALPDRWIYYSYNAEFLLFPYGEQRTIADVTTFMREERRRSVHGIAVDLYPTEPLAEPPAEPPRFALEAAAFDRTGYYATQRFDGPDPLERQSDIFGGLKWRFENHIPWEERRIDRICLFQADPAVTLDERLLFSEPEWNTLSCPWHNNLTLAVASFRTAKGLLQNPGSRAEITRFAGPLSEPFEGTAHQLMTLGFMEPGQWF